MPRRTSSGSCCASDISIRPCGPETPAETATRLRLDPKDVNNLAYVRERDGEAIVVVVNLDDERAEITLLGGFPEGDYYDVMTGERESLRHGISESLSGSGYKVYSTLLPDDGDE